MIKGQRQNLFDMYQAGRKYLLPLIFTRNHHEYGPLVLRDIADFQERCTMKVLKQRKDFFTINGEGLDYKNESLNNMPSYFAPCFRYRMRCVESVDHCVQVEGINFDESYWIIRNSW